VTAADKEVAGLEVRLSALSLVSLSPSRMPLIRGLKAISAIWEKSIGCLTTSGEVRLGKV